MATVEVNQMAFEQSFIGRNKHKQQVPNHLLDTKIFSKVAENDVFQASPSSIHFTGFELKKTSKQILKLTNISSQCQRMHVIPPTASFFKIKYVKKDRLVPGFNMEIAVEFTPSEWRYYYDCIRIHCQSHENLIVPIHGYPALNLSDFPRKLDFGTVAIGESETKNISLKSDIPVDFECKINLLQSIPAIQVEPRQGVIPGNGSLDITVTFSPSEFCTVHSALQLLVSQFNASPRTCHITGCSVPGLKLNLEKKDDIGQGPESLKRTSVNKSLDPASIGPLYRSRLKKLKPQQMLATADVNEEIIRNGIRFPKNLITPSAVSYVLQQRPGKLKAKDIRQAVKEKKDIALSNKQLKETVFEYKVQQNITEERQNQLRWCVKLGEDEISQLERNRILEERAQAEKEYKIKRGDPIADVEFDRSSTSCSRQRIHRQANKSPEYAAKFDFFVNDDWTRRHRILRRFIQAGRKVMVRRRATRYLESLHQNLTAALREGSFFQSSARTHRGKFLDGNISTSFRLKPQMVSPFLFPMVTPADEKDDGIVNPIRTLSVDPTVVHIEPYIPYFKLKVPQQYTLLGYKPHVTQLFISGPASSDVARPLRTGAEDEVISVASSLPHTSDSHVDILEVHTNEEDPTVGESATNEILARVENQSEHVTMAGGKSRLVIPSSFFKKPKYHPLEIFNPLPGLHVLQPQVSYSKIDDDYHLCPLPRYKLTNKSGSNRPDKPFIERPALVLRKFLNARWDSEVRSNTRLRSLPASPSPRALNRLSCGSPFQKLLDLEMPDVISGLMTWKRFPCQNLVICNNVPNITDVWIPRWTSPFMDDLLPKETPNLLNELPDDDVMSDTDSHDEEITDTPANPAALTPAMVFAMFPLIKSSTSQQEEQSDETFPGNGKLPPNNNPVSSRGLIPRNKREKQLSTYVKTCNDRLGRLVRQRMQDMNNLVKDDQLKMTL